MAPFFMAHLKKLPTYFVKEGERRRAAYYTIQARELIEAGYVEEGEKAAPRAPKPLPEIVPEVAAEPYDSTDSLTEPVAEEESLDEMTKAELLEWALERGHDLKNNAPKAEILKACKEIEAAG